MIIFRKKYKYISYDAKIFWKHIRFMHLFIQVAFIMQYKWLMENLLWICLPIFTLWLFYRNLSKVDLTVTNIRSLSYHLKDVNANKILFSVYIMTIVVFIHSLFKLAWHLILSIFPANRPYMNAHTWCQFQRKVEFIYNWIGLKHTVDSITKGKQPL